MLVALKVDNLRSEFVTLGLRVLELFAMYATDGRTKAKLTDPSPAGGGIITLLAWRENGSTCRRQTIGTDQE